MNTEILEALESGYRAFERPARRRIEGCPDCVPSIDTMPLLAKPLRELTAGDLDRYAFKAMTTIGSAEVFRYFWPRIAELAVRDELLTNVEVVFGKLEYGAWHSWPERERTAIDQLADALSTRFAWEALYDPDDWLCALGMFVPDISPHLRPLLAGTPAARTNLTDIWERDERLLPYLQNGFWESARSDNRQTVVEWLGSEAVLEALTR